MRILYATDGSKAGIAGAELLATLPLEPDWTVTVLTVTAPDAPEAAADRVLEGARQALSHCTASLETAVRHGNPATEILHAAEEHPTGLIVLGHQGHSALERFLLGSVAERVVRHAHCPVLLARPGSPSIQQVLFATDGSECAARTGEWLQAFPLPDSSEVRILTVLPSYQIGTWAVAGEVSPAIASLYELQEQERTAALQRLEELGRQFTAAGKRATTELHDGDPATEILRVAAERRVGLLVVGSKGLGGLEKFLLGSVSERVMRHAHSSVLVYRG